MKEKAIDFIKKIQRMSCTPPPPYFPIREILKKVNLNYLETRTERVLTLGMYVLNNNHHHVIILLAHHTRPLHQHQQGV